MIVQNLNVNGGLLVKSGLTKVTLSNIACKGGIQFNSGCHFATVLDCRVIPHPPGYPYTGIVIGSGGPCDNSIIQRCDVSGFENFIIFSGINGQILNNYLHDSVDPSLSTDPHIDGIELEQFGTNGLLIQNNTIIMGSRASSAITGASTGMTINNNLMKGGAYIVRFKYDNTNKVVNNRLGNPGFGYYTNEGGGKGSPVISGNVDDNTGAPV